MSNNVPYINKHGTSKTLASQEKTGGAHVLNVKPGSPRSLMDTNVLTLTSTTTETILIAAIASTYSDITSLVFANKHATTGTVVEIRDDTAGTVRLTVFVPAAQTVHVSFPQNSLKQAVLNKPWTAKCITSVDSVYITAISERSIG
jgi:hypothetical protein